MTDSNLPSITVAHLVNLYPKSSHGLIRRGLHELEFQGVTVHRHAIRRTSEPSTRPVGAASGSG